MTTVKQLIEKLQTMPPDTPVVIQMMSEVIDLDLDSVTLEVNKYILRPAGTRYSAYGFYVTYRESQWDRAKDGEPQLLTVCEFPGN